VTHGCFDIISLFSLHRVHGVWVFCGGVCIRVRGQLIAESGCRSDLPAKCVGKNRHGSGTGSSRPQNSVFIIAWHIGLDGL
jgi:hypothetical protein